MPSPCRLSNGLLLRKSPCDPALTYRALTEEERLRATGVRLWVAKGGASRATVVAGLFGCGAAVRGRSRNLRARLEGGTAGAVRYVGRIGKIAP